MYQRTLFEPEHELFREAYRSFLERHVAPFHDQWEKDKIVDRGVWLEAGKQGFLGMAVPEEFGSEICTSSRYFGSSRSAQHFGSGSPRLCSTLVLYPKPSAPR